MTSVTSIYEMGKLDVSHLEEKKEQGVCGIQRKGAGAGGGVVGVGVVWDGVVGVGVVGNNKK
ncbi:MAG: hypothetical protein GY938_18070 [Ketobacter sp.]|nr:hypothetical protein [Ketobacter sp.]